MVQSFYLSWLNGQVLAPARMSCVQMFDGNFFQNLLSNGEVDGEYDTGQLTNQLLRIYVGVIII